MNIAQLSIKRPVFVTCLFSLVIVLGLFALKKLPVDLFPNVTFPIVTVSTSYPGAGPEEIETLVSRVFEDELSTLPGIKSLRSLNREGVSTVIAEFTLETDIKNAEQQIRDRVSSAKRKLPQDILEPVIRRIDPADQPILILALTAQLPPGELFELADRVVRPRIEQVSQVGLVEVIGGRKREIRVELDRHKMKAREISATQVSNRIAAAGQNIPAGKVDDVNSEVVFRTLAQFKDLKDIENTVVSFYGNDVPVKVSDVGRVIDTLKDETSRVYANGKQSIFLMVYRQSGANTIAVVDGVKKRIETLNEEIKGSGGKIIVTRDSAKPIRANVADVQESIIIGIILTVLVVFFFLGSGRSTIITGLALPNSLLGSFLLMSIAGFSVNVMSLLALSLAVGLLIDDAIVVRENIFRHGELGKAPIRAAIDGTQEVMLAVIATTLTVIAVFGPIGFLQGIVGQFFKEFGLTVCFAMLISLSDALTMAPMLSAYFAAGGHGVSNKNSLWGKTVGRALSGFNKLQDRLEIVYEGVLKFTVRRPMVILGLSFLVLIGSFSLMKGITKTFMPPSDTGEFLVTLELPPGTKLGTTSKLALEVDQLLRSHSEVESAVSIIGGRGLDSNAVTFYVILVPSKKRAMNTSAFKEIIRDKLKVYAAAKPIVKDGDLIGGGNRPFMLNIVGDDLDQLQKVASVVFEKLKIHPALKDAEFSYKPGKPELQAVIDTRRAEMLGVSSATAGVELRTLIEGSTPAVFRENGREFDIRVRLQEDQRNLRTGFSESYVPNINFVLVRLANLATPKQATSPASIDRQDRRRYIQISADIAPNGPGLGGAIETVSKIFQSELKLPEGVRYQFVGQAESFKELMINMAVAAGLGTLFIFLVLASLYESFITPLTIMLVLPLAMSGALTGLYITNSTLDMFSMIGCIMLLGIATKNSILLVDYTQQLVQQGMNRADAIVMAGRTRLRPILMTTFALIAGMLPIAIGLNEASKQRTSMGVAVVGGLISSTLLALIVIPAAYTYIDRFRIWSSSVVKRIFLPAVEREPS